MFMPSKGEMKQGPEPMPGLHAVALTREEFLDQAGKFRMLGNNVLDTSLNERAKGSHGQRKHAMSEIKKSVRSPGEHDVLFAAKDEKGTVGFLAIQKTPEGKIARIRQLWTAHPGHAQRAVVATLLGTAKAYLTDHGYPRLKIEAISPSSDFSVVTANPELGRFLRISHPDADANIEPLDISIAPEDEEETVSSEILPHADNDNSTPLKEIA